MPISESTKQNYIYKLLSDDLPSYLDFLALTYSRCYFPDVVSCLFKTHRQTILWQYNSMWAQWINFLQLMRPHIISQVTLLSFFDLYIQG